jgi:dihydrofolate reductase
MSKLRFRICVSLDGYVAGPNQSVDNPLGVGGMRLHEWAFALRAFREMHGSEGGDVNESSSIVAEQFANVGASVMGRNMFGGQPGPWSSSKPWTGWWGVNPPYHHPVFVITHHARSPLELQGGTTFNFVTGGLQDALQQAKLAAKGKDVSLGGGAQTAREFLRAGLVDEMVLSVVPALLGAGERLFEGMGDNLHGLSLIQTVPAPGVAHLKFAKR